MSIIGTNLDSLQGLNLYTQKGFDVKTTSVNLPLSSVTPPLDEYRRKRIVTENELMYLNNAVETTGISNYSWSLLKDNHSAIRNSQKHLIDLIRYYEGDSNHYYEAITVAYKDKGGNKTIGFGELLGEKKTAITTQNKAYEKLSEHIKEHAKYVKNKVGAEAYASMPNSIKEALIDLSFNSGPGRIGEKIKNAVKQKNWSEVIANISSLSIKGENSADPGLYRRSLSRAILAVRDLKGNEKKEANIVVKRLYQNAIECFEKNNTNKQELNQIYELYTTGKISGNIKSAESGKILVDNSFKGKGLQAVALKAYKELNDKQGFEFKDFYEEFKRINKNPETIILGSELNVPYMKKAV